MGECIDLRGAILVVSSNSFIFSLGREKDDPDVWRVIFCSDGHLSDGVIRECTGGSCHLHLDNSTFSLCMVSGTLIRWKLSPLSAWSFGHRNLPRERGSCWRICHTHPRYGSIYNTYVRAMKERYPCIPRSVCYLTNCILCGCCSEGTIDIVSVKVPQTKIARNVWNGRVTR